MDALEKKVLFSCATNIYIKKVFSHIFIKCLDIYFINTNWDLLEAQNEKSGDQPIRTLTNTNRSLTIDSSAAANLA